MVDVLIISVIVGYAAWTLYRYFRKSRQGACASCSQHKSCHMNQCSSSIRPESEDIKQ
ncbi:FeoB-associated Cys-rich membrane protein [Paenibacillus terrigena]|uniref:FeoB-associated Cys-rich membrane protein n=1 Tax=Paenibacillus terrigena TaxID=369333 RepID=UPI000A030E5C|nr:FeoB-associated Cys-rich membrane protein [Paenibacillus terrigena]